jgi:hypothetical protein
LTFFGPVLCHPILSKSKIFKYVAGSDSTEAPKHICDLEDTEEGLGQIDGFWM